MSIAKLLEAQKVDQQRLTLQLSLEKGKVKVELDKAKQVIVETKAQVLALEEGAKTAQADFSKIEKNLQEILTLVEKAQKDNSQDVTKYSEYLSKLARLESQLGDIERKINEKTRAYEAALLSLKKATEFIQKNTPLYEKQKTEVAAKLAVLEQEFVAKSAGIDEKLLTKYKTIRKNKSGDTKDVVVPLSGHSCGGCFQEVPAATISKISTDGWALCEDCGRIIYK